MRDQFLQRIGTTPSMRTPATGASFTSIFAWKAASRSFCTALVAVALPMALASCQPEAETAAPIPRPVRTITVERSEAGIPVMLTGRVEAEDEVTLAFRIAGRVIENDRKLGERVEPGQVVARLESQNELNTLRTAQANLAAV